MIAPPTPLDPMRPNPCRRLAVGLALLLAGLALPRLTSAQSEATGMIEGRVVNPQTGQYTERARIVVEGTRGGAHARIPRLRLSPDPRP